MRLLLISQDFSPAVGGVQTYADRMALAFSRRHEVTVLAPAARGAAEHDAGLPYPVLRWPSGGAKARGPVTARFPTGIGETRVAHRAGESAGSRRLPAAASLLDGPVQNLLTSGFGAVVPLALPLAAWRTGARVAFHAQVATAAAAMLAVRWRLLDRYYVAAHGREVLWAPLGAPQRAWRRAVFSGAAAVFAVSRFTAEAVRALGVPAERIAVVPNGVDRTRFRPVDPSELRRRLGLAGRRVVLSAGRLVPRKGVDTLLEAFGVVHAVLADAVLVIAGEGPDRERLEAMAVARRVPVRFLGRVPDEELPALYGMADVFALAAREEPGGDAEGFGLVLLEAAACGTPCVASRSGGVPDAVDDGRSGLLVPPADAGELATTLLRVLGDGPLRTRLAAGALARAARSGWETTAAAILGRMEGEGEGKGGNHRWTQMNTDKGGGR
ncbi:MAG: glycosyltransferase [Deltaproteobacteria bacterium]|nr:glycosyltransferase [Deltaproteobacteria bacterium]